MDNEGTKSTVKLALEYKSAWLTWVAATTTCLKSLGVECDLIDVAGTTGYAYVMSVSRDVCPSGPTMFDWGMLESGVNLLGRSTKTFRSGDCHIGEFVCDRTTSHCREAFNLAKSEIDLGRPVVFWGAYVPEFAVAWGYEGDSYLVKSWKPFMGEEDEPIPFDKIEAPGGPYVMAFPTVADTPNRQYHADRLSIRRAANLLTAESLFNTHETGIKAYDYWIEGLATNTANSFGNAYNSQCWAEARSFAMAHLRRIAERNPFAANPLIQAADHYENVTAALIEMAKLFPFPPGDQLKDEANRRAAIEHLRNAQSAETRAAIAISEAAHLEWPHPGAAASGD